MNSHIARQPIFDLDHKVHAYELLFRNGIENAFPRDVDGDKATSSVLSDGFFSMGIDTITGGYPAFVNFTRDILLGGFAELIPSSKLVIEILEDVTPDPKVLAVLERLKKIGFRIALDDYRGSDHHDSFLRFADLIKVDFKATSRDDQRHISRKFRPSGVKLVAEKLETHEDIQSAKAMGFHFFQGFFYCKPAIVNKGRIPENKLNKLELLKEVNRPELDIDRIQELVKHDVEMSYKLLRYINSAYFGLRNEATDIRQALVYLGFKNLRKWASLMAVACLGGDKPDELLVTSLVRARFCELAARHVDLLNRSEELFLMGMFSVIDALLDMSMEDALASIPLAPDLKLALLGEQCRLKHILDFAISYEMGNWEFFEYMKDQLSFDENAVPELHLDAVKTAEELLHVGS